MVGGVGGLLWFEGDGGGQENPDQAETSERDQSNQEDRHKMRLHLKLSDAKSGGSMIVVTRRCDGLTVPVLRREAAQSRETWVGSEEKPARLRVCPECEEAGSDLAFL